MRRLIWLGLVLGILWCLWWFGASAVLRSGVDQWLADRRAEGWVAEARSIDGAGFPGWLQARLNDARFVDPGTGVSVAMDNLTLAAAAWWPGRARVFLPQTPITLESGGETGRLTMADAVLAMDLAPSRDLTLRNLSWTSGAWGFAAAEGSLLSAEDLTLSMVQGEEPARYDFAARANATALGEAPRAALRIPTTWPVAFDVLELDATVEFDRPWDLRSLADRRPQPRKVALRQAEARWGDLQFRLAADLEADAAGLASGTITVQARNWRDILTLAENAGLLPSNLRPQAENILNALASAGGNPETIDVTLRAEDGRLRLGFIPVGLAPRLALP